MDEKLVEKLQKIRDHAESAKKIGSEAEAQAFAEMLQKLLLKHKLEMSDLEFEKAEQEEPISGYDVNWQDVRVRGRRVGWIERLASIVARAHFCKILVHTNSSRITLIGRKSDAAVAEFVLVTLVRSMDKIAGTAMRAYAREGGITTGFRAGFVAGFVQRLRQRYDEEQRREAGTGMALMRVNRSLEAVTAFTNALPWVRKVPPTTMRSSFNAEAFNRGKAAADRVNLRSTGIEAGRPVKTAGVLR